MYGDQQHLDFDAGPSWPAIAPQFVEREPPAVAHSETSRAAAASVRLDAKNKRAAVYREILAAGVAGLTDLEIEQRTGMGGSTVRPRRRELEQAGFIRKADATRPTPSGRQATVWIATASLER